MAKKQSQQPSNKNLSQAQGFTGGMITDPNPRYQIKGSYRDALNIRLSNDDQSTFTVENILGNKKVFNLDDICSQTHDASLPEGILGTRVAGKAGATTTGDNFSEIYMDPSTLDVNEVPVGDYFPSDNNNTSPPLSTSFEGIVPFIGTMVSNGLTSYPGKFNASIVGHYSYNRNVIFIIVIPHYSYPATKTQTIFLNVRFDKDLNVELITDLMVSYDHLNQFRYPDLNMDLDMPVRVEGIVENECISRIFWTDNKNPLRSINVSQPGKNKLSPDVLDLTPLHTPSQVVVTKSLSGSLPVGQLQYCYKYVSSNGGESVMSPFSNLYHTSKQSFSSSSQYYGSSSGDPYIDVSSQGFEITIKDLDNDFDIIELYSILHVQNDGPVRVSRVGSKQFTSGATDVVFYHTQWSGDLIDGTDEVLIDTNTWDVCKDIAIKDNILFAGNLRTRDNTISEKEWNVKIRRYNIADENSGGSSNTGRITSNDSQINEYEILSGATTASSVTPSLGETWTNGMPKWRTYKGDDVSTIGGTDYDDNGRTDVHKKQCHEYRYLSDGMTLGGESYDYSENQLGGCRVTFGLKEKPIDIQNNVSAAPYIQASSISGMSTDNISDDGSGGNVTDNTNTTFTATMAIGGSKDPAVGNFKGYRRGEMYRFGVQLYDKNGRQGNVLWIGDIEMPEMNDPLRMLRTQDSDYDPTRPTNDGTTNSLHHRKLFASHPRSGDHRTSYIYGVTTPSIDVAWFNQTIGPWTNRDTLRYVATGEFTHRVHNPAPSSTSISKETSTNTGDGVDLLAAFVAPNGQWDSGTNSGWYSPKVFSNISTLNHNYFTVKQLPARHEANSHDDIHYALDLFVNFEFRIPSDVRDKISGFRVVRAEREYSDKSILQQGILNQTVAYGHNEPKKGYNQTTAIKETDSEEDGLIKLTSGVIMHNIYDSVLNGYIGLAENSNLAFWQTGANSAFKLLHTSAAADEHIYPFNEFEEATARSGGGYHWSDVAIDYATYHTPFNDRSKRRHSAYFGSYEVMPNTQDQWGTSGPHKIRMNEHQAKHWSGGACAHAVQGSIFTLDSPDSAFAFSPYNFRTGDKIRVDAIMKLVYDHKTEIKANTDPAGINAHLAPFGSANSSGNNFGPPNSSLPLPSGDRNAVQATAGTNWFAQDKTHTAEDSLRYCRKIDTGSSEEGYAALVAKYYIYDTYYGIGMSMDGGAGYAAGHNPGPTGIIDDSAITASGNAAPTTRYNPSQHHDIYHHTILQAKELFPGEIVGQSFFKEGVLMIDEGEKAFSHPTVGIGYATNIMNGFSNNTLGFYAGGRQKRTNGDTWYSGGTSFLFSALKDVTSYWSASTNKYDRTYDTISTVQQGKRTILLQIDGDGDDGEKRGLLNPRDLSAILEHRNWGQGAGGSVYHAFQSKISRQNSGITRKGGISGHVSVGGGNRPDGDWGGPSYIPYKFLCSIIRNNIPYGGPGLNAIMSTRYIPAGNYHSIKKDAGGNSEEGHLSQVFGGDTFITFYSHQKTCCPYEQRSYARWQIFPVESDVNTDMRMGYHLGAGDLDLGEVQPDNNVEVGNDFIYNDVYSQENNLKSAISVDESKTCKSLELPYQIAHSETKISGEPADSFRVFLMNSFHDMESQYGEITRLTKWKNDVYVLQESSLSKLMVNPISMIADELGTTLNVGTGETIENHLYISTKFGTRHMESVVPTESALYYIDNTYGKLLQYTGSELKIISDDLGQRDALNNIIKGVGDLDSLKKVGRNFICDNSLKFNGITSIFDYKNNELIITMHSSVLDADGNREITRSGTDPNYYYFTSTNSKTLVYSESINAFTSYYSVTPRRWMDIGGYVTSTESMTYLEDDSNNFNDNYLSVWKWDEQINNYKTVFFNEDPAVTGNDIELSSITKSISEIPSETKVFDNAKIIMTPNTKSNLTNSWAQFGTEIINNENLDIDNNTAAKYQEGILRFPLRDTNKPGPRMRGTYINIKYSTRSTNKFNIFAILAKYRKSYQ
jgi:hypothetical protein